MKSYYRKKTSIFPEIDFNIDTGVFNIIGPWLPYSGVEYELFNEIYKWLNVYIENPCPKTVLTLNLPYFGTSASKFLLNVLVKFDTLYENGSKVEVNWCYDPEDEDLEEAGTQYDDLVKIPINMVHVEENR